MENLLNATQAADIVGVSKMTMAEWCARGYVPRAQKVGKTWIIPESSLHLIERPEMGRPPKENGNGREHDDV